MASFGYFCSLTRLENFCPGRVENFLVYAYFDLLFGLRTRSMSWSSFIGYRDTGLFCLYVLGQMLKLKLYPVSCIHNPKFGILILVYFGYAIARGVEVHYHGSLRGLDRGRFGRILSFFDSIDGVYRGFCDVFSC